MCTTCGCGKLEAPVLRGIDLGQLSFTPVAEAAGPPPGAEETRRVALETAILDKNNRFAESNRAWFAAHGVVALNLVSAPGSGKTTLLERTIREKGGALGVRVIEGDQATELDANRIRAAGAPVVQINTGTGCHLDAQMIERALPQFQWTARGVLLIENVGNLVCPALFDLGERARVVVASVTEGEDKPLKYPHMFRSCGTVVLNKIDLQPHVGFDLARFRDALAEVNPRAHVLPLSARTGEGIAAWYEQLDRWAASS